MKRNSITYPDTNTVRSSLRNEKERNWAQRVGTKSPIQEPVQETSKPLTNLEKDTQLWFTSNKSYFDSGSISYQGFNPENNRLSLAFNYGDEVYIFYLECPTDYTDRGKGYKFIESESNINKLPFIEKLSEKMEGKCLNMDTILTSASKTFEKYCIFRDEKRKEIAPIEKPKSVVMIKTDPNAKGVAVITHGHNDTTEEIEWDLNQVKLQLQEQEKEKIKSEQKIEDLLQKLGRKSIDEQQDVPEVQEESKEVIEEVTKEIPKETVEEVIEVVEETIEETVEEVVEVTPKETIEENPKEAPEETIEETPKENLKETLQEAPKENSEEDIENDDIKIVTKTSGKDIVQNAINSSLSNNAEEDDDFDHFMSDRNDTNATNEYSDLESSKKSEHSEPDSPLDAEIGCVSSITNKFEDSDNEEETGLLKEPKDVFFVSDDSGDSDVEDPKDDIGFRPTKTKYVRPSAASVQENKEVKTEEPAKPKSTKNKAQTKIPTKEPETESEEESEIESEDLEFDDDKDEEPKNSSKKISKKISDDE